MKRNTGSTFNYYFFVFIYCLRCLVLGKNNLVASGHRPDMKGISITSNTKDTLSYAILILVLY